MYPKCTWRRRATLHDFARRPVLLLCITSAPTVPHRARVSLGLCRKLIMLAVSHWGSALPAHQLYPIMLEYHLGSALQVLKSVSTWMGDHPVGRKALHYQRTNCTSVATKITNLPKLTNKELSYTGIGWENPVSKCFLPKTKFRLGFTR